MNIRRRKRRISSSSSSNSSSIKMIPKVKTTFDHQTIKIFEDLWLLPHNLYIYIYKIYLENEE